VHEPTRRHTKPIALEEKQLAAVIRRLEHLERVVRGIRLASRDLPGADRLRVENAIAEAFGARPAQDVEEDECSA
jgi:hypothetical protein